MDSIRLLTIAAVLTTGAAVAMPRSAAERAAFVREHPCPATGKRHGPCPGWQVDHIAPLKCGGADKPVNMQWLTVRQHKAKTAAESPWCRYPKPIPGRTTYPRR